MLDSLKSFDPATASKVLVDAVLGQVAEGAPLSNVPEGAVRNVLSEIRSRLKIEPEDNSQRARLQIGAELEKAIDDLVSSEKLNAAAQRIGARGVLPVGSYEIKFNGNFKPQFKPLGEREKRVRDLIRNAQEIQHLSFLLDGESPDDLDINDETAVSLILSKDGRGANEHYVLIQTHREGSSLIVQGVWHFMPSKFTLSDEMTPKDALVEFAQLFGVSVFVAGVRGRIVESVTLDTTSPLIQTGMDINQGMGDIRFPPDTFSIASYRVSEKYNKSIVGFAYAIDMHKYRSALIECFGRKWLSDRP